jgi:hypothetical protein
LVCSSSIIAQNHPDTSRYALSNKDSIVLPRHEDSTQILKIEAVKYDSNQIENGLNDLMKIQSENHARQKKAAIIRIAIGIFFLGVLVVGLLRSRRNS